MDALIEALSKRYGSQIDYNSLTEQQRLFLIHPEISDSKDSGGFTTVDITQIREHDGHPVLELRDSKSYLWARTRLRPWQVAEERHPAYQRIGCIGTIEHCAGDCTGNYVLPDNSEIKVRFEAIRYRV
ncbi:MAG: hypothetical protein WC254_00830 [Candidatus Woesearchaeota archaeon]